MLSTVQASVSAPGGAGWQAPVGLSSPAEEADSPALAVNLRGETLASWGAQTDDSYGTGVAVGGAGGNWQAPVELPDDARFALEPDGGAVAIAATQETGGEEPNKIEVVTRPADADEWQAPVTLSSGSESVEEPSIAVGPDGEAVAAWVAGGIVYVALRSSATAVWTPQVALSEASVKTRAPQVAVDAEGDALVAWQTGVASQPLDEVLQATVRPAVSGQWGAPVAISEPGLSFGAITGYRLAVNSQDQAFAIWEQSTPVSGEALEVSTGSAASGSWGAPVDLSALGPAEGTPAPAADALARPSVGRHVAARNPQAGVRARDAASRHRRRGLCQAYTPPGSPQGEGVEVAFDTAGDTTVIWTHHVGWSSTVRAAVKPASGGWETPQNVSDTFAGDGGASLAVDGQGDAIATWIADGTVQAAVRPYTGGVWQTPVDLSGEHESVWGTALAANPSGEAVLAWQDEATTIDAVRLNSTGLLSGPVTPPPVIASARITNTRFQAEREDGHYPTNLPIGTDFQFKLSQPAHVEITITGTEPGLREDGQCIAPTSPPRDEHAGERCTRTYTAATLLGNGRKGTIRFTGTETGPCRSEPLPPGRYRAVLIANSPGGYSQPAALPFTIVR